MPRTAVELFLWSYDREGWTFGVPRDDDTGILPEGLDIRRCRATGESWPAGTRLCDLREATFGDEQRASATRVCCTHAGRTIITARRFITWAGWQATVEDSAGHKLTLWVASFFPPIAQTVRYRDPRSDRWRENFVQQWSGFDILPPDGIEAQLRER